MTLTWLPGAQVHDLHPAIGNGPFGAFYGVILHVNVDEYGTPDSFWGNGNPGQVCPNFQVYKDGTIHQMLPLDWQPWCQINGNFNYAAIETAGLPSEPLTDAQLKACATIVRAYHDQMGMPLTVADAPGQRGLGTHEMGGSSWGGHPCPGTIRAGQRRQILALASTKEFTVVDPETKTYLDQQFAALKAAADDFPTSIVSPVNGKPYPVAQYLGTLDSRTWQLKGAIEVLAQQLFPNNPAAVAAVHHALNTDANPTTPQ